MVARFFEIPRVLAAMSFASGCAMAFDRLQEPHDALEPPSAALSDEDAPVALCLASTSLDHGAPRERVESPANGVDAPDAERCSNGMVLVEGDYCPAAKQECVRWMESPAAYSYARCA
ncbi:MAG TPA: hypothetical protein VJT73_01000, partial [Polyangiaceae bacterium]|nr:hypothetical protein [Polyangiaceae bacterium]